MSDLNTRTSPTSHASALVLIAEDEAEIADILIAYLQRSGLRTQHACDGQQALALHQALKPDLLLLDVHMPVLDGWKVLSEIRSRGETPVIMLTALDQDIDKLMGLRLGADDYVVKPFSPREISARVRAILRRTRAEPVASEPSAPAELFLHDAERRRIRYHQQWLELTRYEYLILSTLLRRPEHVLSRDQLMEAVWADPGASLDRVIDTHIKGIRTKLKRILPSHDPIVTHRGLGYSINPQLPGADG